MEDWFGKCLNVKIINKGRDKVTFGIEPSVFLKFEDCEVNLIAAWEEFYSHYTIELMSPSGRLYWNKSTIDWNEVINDDLADGYKKLDDLEKQMINMRIQFAELASPGHPGRQRNWSNREE